MIRGCLRRAGGLLLIASLAGCNGYDSEYIPYALTGLDVWVYDNQTGEELTGGHVDANYLSRREALAQCNSTAVAVANQHHIEDWSYVCCTMTHSSNCVTKVR